MDHSAHTNSKILIINVGSYLGASLAKSFLVAGFEVYGVGSSPLIGDLLYDHHFTLLEFDLSQPVPSHLPRFDIIFDLSSLSKVKPGSFPFPHLPPSALNIISHARTKSTPLFMFAPISVDTQIYDYLAKDEQTQELLNVFLVGDVYGPGMDLAPKEPVGEVVLQELITQAVTADKVILENEGLKIIYPAYITDVIFAVHKFITEKSSKNIRFLVSESPETSLSVSYEIQKALAAASKKEIGLFFIDSHIATGLEAQTAIRIHDLGFSPKVGLAEGLKNTFEFFAPQNQAQTSIPQSNQPATHLPVQLPNYPTTKLPNKFQRFTVIRARTAEFSTKLSFPKSRAKSVIAAVISLIILAAVFTVVDIYRGISNLKDSQKAFTSGDLEKARKMVRNATASFDRDREIINFALYPANFVFPGPTKSINYSLKSASLTSSSLSYFIDGTGILMKDLSLVSSKQVNQEAMDTDTPIADYRKAYLISQQAATSIKTAIQTSPKFMISRLQNAQNSIGELNNLSASTFEFTNLISDLTATESSKTYLILLQNNTELRPGGGFIGSYALMNFDSGRLKDVSVDDIYNVDGQLKEKIKPPKELTERLGLDQFYLRDSNWNPDFQKNAAIVRDFFKKETGKDVDGVIAIDLNFIQSLLGKTGPVKLASYQEEIGADNLFDKGEFHSEVGFVPGSTQKKDFFGSLSSALINRLIGNSDKVSPLGIVEAVKESLTQKHIMMIFDNPNLASYVHLKGWDAPLPPASFNPVDDSKETRDFLALAEANLGGNKVNKFIDRRITYEVTVGRDADLTAKLTINYKNNSLSDAWPTGKYINFLRVYVPAQANLLQINNGGITDPKTVEVTGQNSLTTFATYVEVPTNSQKQVTFTYRVPKNIKLETAPIYHLYIEKQAGTEKDPLEFELNLPNYMVTKSLVQDGQAVQQITTQNLDIQTDLSTDRQFKIEIAKK